MQYEAPRQEWLLAPGFYHDFDQVVGAELSLIRGMFGGVVGGDRTGAYLEAELILGPLTFGFGPRWQRGEVTPQTTFSLPFFFVFPYWRWRQDADTRNSVKEYGIMIKLPLDPGKRQRGFAQPKFNDDVI